MHGTYVSCLHHHHHHHCHQYHLIAIIILSLDHYHDLISPQFPFLPLLPHLTTFL